MACVYVVNTCEYCLETIPKLHSMIEDKIQGFEIDLQEQSSIPFRELINTVLIALAKSVSLRLEPIYQAQMHTVNWSQFSDVCEQKYTSDVSSLILHRSGLFKKKINMTYWLLLCNKFVATFIPQYFANVCSLKKISENSAHQFQLDLEELKNV